MPESSQTGFLVAKKEPKQCELHLARALEAKLTQGRNTDKLPDDAVSLRFNEEDRFIRNLKFGEGLLQRVEYLTREQRSNP